MSVTDALYHALIVEHDRSPRNTGMLPGATHRATLDNPLCGDIVTVHFVVDGVRITSATFDARGCALCRAAASMMTVRVTGMGIEDAQALVTRFTRFVDATNDATNDDTLGELVAFRGVQAVRSRRTCATLPFRALASALAGPPRTG